MWGRELRNSAVIAIEDFLTLLRPGEVEKMRAFLSSQSPQTRKEKKLLQGIAGGEKSVLDFPLARIHLLRLSEKKLSKSEGGTSFFQKSCTLGQSRRR